MLAKQHHFATCQTALGIRCVVKLFYVRTEPIESIFLIFCYLKKSFLFLCDNFAVLNFIYSDAPFWIGIGRYLGKIQNAIGIWTGKHLYFENVNKVSHPRFKLGKIKYIHAFFLMAWIYSAGKSMDTIKKCGVLFVAKQGKFPVNAPKAKHTIHVVGMKKDQEIEQTIL